MCSAEMAAAGELTQRPRAGGILAFQTPLAYFRQLAPELKCQAPSVDAHTPGLGKLNSSSSSNNKMSGPGTTWAVPIRAGLY